MLLLVAMMRHRRPSGSFEADDYPDPLLRALAALFMIGVIGVMTRRNIIVVLSRSNSC